MMVEACHQAQQGSADSRSQEKAHGCAPLRGVVLDSRRSDGVAAPTVQDAIALRICGDFAIVLVSDCAVLVMASGRVII